MRTFTSWVFFFLLLVFLFRFAHVKLNLKLSNLVGNKFINSFHLDCWCSAASIIRLVQLLRPL